MADPIPRIMSPEESQAIAREFIKRQAENGLTRCLGFHGCSAETLMHAITYGVIPGHYRHEHGRDGYDVEPGDLYYWPIETEIPVNRAASYAERIAKKHYFAKTLGLDLRDEENNIIAGDLTFETWEERDKVYFEKLARMGITREKALAVADEAEFITGFVIGFRPSVAHMYPIKDVGRFGDDGSCISTGNGLPYGYIQGIRPLGPSAELFLKTLL